MGRQPEPNLRRMVHSPARLAFRFLTGRPLDGIRRTDAIFIRPGRTSMDPSGYATKWSYLAGYQRLLIRLGLVYIAAWALALTFAWAVRGGLERAGMTPPEWSYVTPGQVLVSHLVWVLVLGGPASTFYAVRYFGLSLRVPVLALHRSRTRPWVWVTLEGWVPWVLEGRRGWDREKVRPVALVADAVLGTHHLPRKARTWVQVPRNYKDQDGKPVIIQLPASFTGSDKGTMTRLTGSVSAKLGLRDPQVRWDLEGDRPRVLFTAPPVPPTYVSFVEVRSFYEEAEEFSFFLGLAARRAALTANLKGDSPHIAVSAGSGAGKSELIKGLIMLALRWGWGVVILDWKEVSHTWADGLPGVAYVRDIADIHDMAVRLGEEVDLRKAAYRQDSSLPGRAKMLVVAEEMNITADLLKAYWDDLRATAEPEERRTMPLKSPAMRGLMAVNFAGRQLGMFMDYVAQRFSARVTNGNADLRESFQIRLLARYSPQTQKMLAPDVKPFPKMPTVVGQWVAVMGGEAVVYQAPFITDSEAREFALGGLPNPPSPLSQGFRPAMPNRDNMDHGLGGPLGGGPAVPSQRQGALEGDVLARVDARKLSEMVEGLSHLGVTLDVLRHATKDPESGFPGAYGGSPNRGYTYDYRAVQEWARTRHASRVAEREVR